MDREIQILVDLLAALGTGVLIGIERGWIEQKDGDKDRIVGIFGFAMAGLLGGIWAEIAAFVNDWILSILFVAFALLIAAAQLQLTKAHDDTEGDITTSIALLITFSLGGGCLRTSYSRPGYCRSGYCYFEPKAGATPLAENPGGSENSCRYQISGHLRNTATPAAEQEVWTVECPESLLDMVDGGSHIRAFIFGTRTHQI